MEENENIKERPEDGKSGSPEEIHENQTVNIESGTSNEELQIINHPIKQASYKPETQNMEVHHHPQLEHNPKPWKEYLLEGLMIFLAVTLGFFAENFREHISDSHRENEFAKELYAELKDDSAIAANRLLIRIEKEKDMDYVHSYFRDSTLNVLPKNFYPAFTTSLYLINSYAFEPKDGILSQLRNSGSLRYFKSVELQKLLGDIGVCINNVRYRNDQEYQYFASPLKLFLLKYYDFHWLDQLRREYDSAYLLNLINSYRKGNKPIEGKILNASSLDRSEACNMILFYKQMLVSTQSLQLNNYIIANRKILQVLRENYSLDNE
jgi:hypothetical protein